MDAQRMLVSRLHSAPVHLRVHHLQTQGRSGRAAESTHSDQPASCSVAGAQHAVQVASTVKAGCLCGSRCSRGSSGKGHPCQGLLGGRQQALWGPSYLHIARTNRSHAKRMLGAQSCADTHMVGAIGHQADEAQDAAHQRQRPAVLHTKPGRHLRAAQQRLVSPGMLGLRCA